MNAAIEGSHPGQQTANSAKPLWAAVGILGVAVLAMGGTMIFKAQPAAPAAPLVAAAPAALTKPITVAPGAPSAPSAADDLIEKPVVTPAKPAPTPVAKVVKPAPKVAPAPAPSPTASPAPQVAGNAPAAAPSPATYPATYPAPAPYSAPVTNSTPAPVAIVQVCGNCGAVESVTPIERTTKPDGPGVGAVAGGVAGAVLGNQVGQGNGRTVATIIGAIGGGLAGNAIEKNARKETVYQVGVRMEDGTRRSVEVAQPPAVGSKVLVDGSSIRANNGGGGGSSVYNSPAPVLQRTSQGQQTPVYQPN